MRRLMKPQMRIKIQILMINRVEKKKMVTVKMIGVRTMLWRRLSKKMPKMQINRIQFSLLSSWRKMRLSNKQLKLKRKLRKNLTLICKRLRIMN